MILILDPNIRTCEFEDLRCLNNVKGMSNYSLMVSTSIYRSFTIVDFVKIR